MKADSSDTNSLSKIEKDAHHVFDEYGPSAKHQFTAKQCVLLKTL